MISDPVTKMWRDLLEIAMMRQTTAFDLVEETVELYGPTSRVAAAAYANWSVACEQHQSAEDHYRLWRIASRRAECQATVFRA